MRQHSSAIRQGECKERSDEAIDYAGEEMATQDPRERSDKWGPVDRSVGNQEHVKNTRDPERGPVFVDSRLGWPEE